jgi:hypothetical protein
MEKSIVEKLERELVTQISLFCNSITATDVEKISTYERIASIKILLEQLYILGKI